MNFLVSLLGIKKIWIYLGGALFLFVTVSGAYLAWQRSIERNALLRFNQTQLEQTLREQEEFMKRQRILEDEQRTIARQLHQENQRLRSRVDSIQTILNSPEFSAADRPASEILRRTIQELQTGAQR